MPVTVDGGGLYTIPTSMMGALTFGRLMLIISGISIVVLLVIVEASLTRVVAKEALRIRGTARV